MKRVGNLYSKIISMENLCLADKKAQKGKSAQHGVIIHNRQRGCNLIALHNSMSDKSYKTSEYSTFKIYEPKERIVFRLPYFPDRILHHAVMNILEPIFVSVFTRDTYSCIKGKGIHAASFGLRKALLNKDATTYCLKMDIKKFYPSVDHGVLKTLLRKKFKDKDLLWLLDEVIDSTDEGLPIGNYLSQYFANFMLAYFDHWIKEELKVCDYFRYLDDMVLLSNSKPQLHEWLFKIREYLRTLLKLELKGNYQIFPVAARGIDFVGYPTFHDHVKLRKGIKKRFARMLKYDRNNASIASYMGWLKHCNGNNLTKKLLYDRDIKL